MPQLMQIEIVESKLDDRNQEHDLQGRLIAIQKDHPRVPRQNPGTEKDRQDREDAIHKGEGQAQRGAV